MQNLNRIWVIGAGILILALIAIALATRPQISAPTETATSTATSTQANVGVSGNGDFTVEQESIPEIIVPDYQKAIQFSSTVSADVKTALQQAVQTLSERLAQDSFDLKSWIDLGTVRKMGGDYKGAEEAWLFVTRAAPRDTIAYNNLGDLYMNFLKDYPKAEQAYLTAIKLNPAEASAYQELSSLYTNLYKKGTSAGEAILRKGIASVPESTDLHVLLARYYKSAGRTSEAKAAYEAAITLAQKAGNTDAVAQLKIEQNQ